MDCAEYRDAQITDIGHEQASALKVTILCFWFNSRCGVLLYSVILQDKGKWGTVSLFGANFLTYFAYVLGLHNKLVKVLEKPHRAWRCDMQQDITPDWRTDLVVVSPLTRALQTACLAFQNTDTEMVVNPCVTGIPRSFVVTCACCCQGWLIVLVAAYLNYMFLCSHTSAEV